MNAIKTDFVGGGRKCMDLIKCLAKRSGDGLADLSGRVLLLCYILHQVIYLINVPNKRRERQKIKHHWGKKIWKPFIVSYVIELEIYIFFYTYLDYPSRFRDLDFLKWCLQSKKSKGMRFGISNNFTSQKTTLQFVHFCPDSFINKCAVIRFIHVTSDVSPAASWVFPFKSIIVLDILRSHTVSYQKLNSSVYKNTIMPQKRYQ